MDAIELLQLTSWIDREIVAREILNRYSDLLSVIQSNVQPNRQRQPFESQKETLFQVLRAVKLDELTQEQKKFLENLRILPYIGQRGVVHLEEIFYKNNLDLATVAERLQQIQNAINNGVAKSNQIKDGLTGYVTLPESHYEHVLLRVYFQNDASINNISDLKDWAGIWYNISRGITMIHGGSPEDVKLVGASKGSVIVELAVTYAIAKSISEIMLKALELADRVLELKKKSAELRLLKLSSDNAAKFIDEEAKAVKENGVERIAQDIVLKVKIDPNKHGDQVKALNTAVKGLVDFLQKGGEVDYQIRDGSTAETDEANENAKDIAQLRKAITDIRALESKLKVIEYKSE